MSPQTKINYEHFLDCVHCGLCTASCPTYVELGNENDSPRGRIYLMRAVTDGRLPMSDLVRGHLELCLDCRACESACPSGVQYGRLIEPFRVSMEAESPSRSDDWFHRLILFGIFPSAQRTSRALAPVRLLRRWGVFGLAQRLGMFRLLPRQLRRLTEMLPDNLTSAPPLPTELPAKGKRRARVALFTGCVADAMFRQTHWATARVLQENGCDVIIPRGQQCCGAIHFHAGQEAPARELAERNMAAFRESDFDALIVNVAGCGAMLRDYPHHWPGDVTESFAARVRDVHEFLDELGLIPPTGSLPLTATYHDACHLAHAQGVRAAPRRLLASIPDLRLLDLPESDLCCGAAGTYNLTQPEMAARLGNRKLQNIEQTRARVAVTANAGCLLQIARVARQRRTRLAVVHPMDLLDLSYRQAPFDIS